MCIDEEKLRVENGPYPNVKLRKREGRKETKVKIMKVRVEVPRCVFLERLLLNHRTIIGLTE